MASQTDLVIDSAESATDRLGYLKAVHAQKFGIAIGRGLVAQMRIMAGRALHLAAFQRQLRLCSAHHAIPDERPIGTAQLAVQIGKRGVVGE